MVHYVDFGARIYTRTLFYVVKGITNNEADNEQ